MTSLTSHYPRWSHMVTYEYKEGWEMTSLFSMASFSPKINVHNKENKELYFCFLKFQLC